MTTRTLCLVLLCLWCGRGFAQALSSDSIATQNAGCIHCHRQRGGPFRYEHAAIQSEGCVSCHDPKAAHDPHQPQPTREPVNVLCQRCHVVPTTAKTGEPMPHAHQDPNATCTHCHSAVHGSNASPFFLHAAAAAK
jgi:predicted CXXCH cytochrome family protein